MPELTKIQTGFLEPQGPFKLDPGTESAPGIYLEGDENTGLYRTAEDEIGVSIDGTQKYNFTSEGLKFNGTSLDGTPFMGAIDKDITDTAVDVFVYDTSRDSDGGAWRKRTQHTSWYNEELNTATRGSRREFPAVAVIVATASSVTIYDGDDPDLPMWMVFTKSSDANVYWIGGDSYAPVSSSTITAINGIIASGISDAAGGRLTWCNFISDEGYNMVHVGKWKFNGGIGTRNDGLGWYQVSSTLQLVNRSVNDVAMTVLPTAPIDPDTGLQVPTIAVATNDGISVIKDDGTVISTTSSSSGYYVRKINFTDNFGINAIISTSSGGNWTNVYVKDFKSLDGFTYAQYNNWDGVVYRTKYDPKALTYLTASINDTISNFISLDGRSNAIGTSAIGGGLTILEKSPRSAFDPDEGMVAFATTSYNTGWMHGNIKGAFLSDTDATNVTGTELITNGSSGFSGTSGWYLDDTNSTSGTVATIAESSGTLVFTHGSTTNHWDGFGVSISTVIGKSYVILADIAVSTDMNSIRITNTASQHDTSPYNPGGFNGPGEHQYTFIATATTTYIHWNGYVSTATMTLNSFSVRLADPDRSVNNKGLQVFGTITKTPVATGAELVAYSNWSTSNYLSQPYNPDLDVGTGDFSIAVWIKATSFDAYNTVFAQWRENQTSTEQFSLETVGSVLRFYVVKNGAFVYAGGNTTLSTNVWYHIVVKRIGGVIYMYVNAEQESTTLDYSGDLTTRTDPTTVGVLWSATGQSGGATGPWKGYISLLRFSGSAPSAEQIKKIYEDEKVLFQENADCTLYGSSDAVTALAYDEKTNLLHVGTSSGRSDFNGLRRINNTTEAVTTAISAYDGSIAQQ